MTKKCFISIHFYKVLLFEILMYFILGERRGSDLSNLKIYHLIENIMEGRCILETLAKQFFP